MILFQEGICSIVLMPLVVKRKVMGTFLVGSKKREAYDEATEAIVRQIGGLVATASNNSMLFEQLQSQLARLRRTQSQLIRSARLAAVGELADGVAHEINNPLSVVLGVVQLLLRQPGMPPGALDDLEKVYASAERIASITRTFIEFAKPATAGKQSSLQITEVAESALLLVQSQFSDVVESIQIERQYSPDLPMVKGNEGQLRRALLAIIRNAFEAMIRAASQSPERVHELRLVARSRSEGSHRFVDVVVEDTGSGIPENHLNRIFEPGFTTKIEMGTVRGLGMGLFSAYSIIDTHGGDTNVESEVGRGTRVTVTLPAS
jgi:signal transduction histidine kinase